MCTVVEADDGLGGLCHGIGYREHHREEEAGDGEGGHAVVAKNHEEGQGSEEGTCFSVAEIEPVAVHVSEFCHIDFLNAALAEAVSPGILRAAVFYSAKLVQSLHTNVVNNLTCQLLYIGSGVRQSRHRCRFKYLSGTSLMVIHLAISKGLITIKTFIHQQPPFHQPV